MYNAAVRGFQSISGAQVKIMINGDAAAAEKVFRADLDRNPRNPRSLYGLQQALKAQNKNYDAGSVEAQFRDSWKGGEVKVEDLV
jgi:hypothetical protein